MKKIIYIEYIKRNELIGVNNKINAQCTEFTKHYETVLIYPDGNDICINNFNKRELKKIKNALGVRGFKGNPIFNRINNLIRIIKFNLFIRKLLLKEKPQIIYIRKYNMLNAVRILRNFKNKNDTCIIYEIPTYPYDQEFKNNRKYLMYLLNKKIDRSMEKIADLIPVVLGKEVKFECKKYFSTFNGIDVNSINITSCNSPKKNSIDLVGIANLSSWHGYDRVIEGLKKYYTKGSKIKVIFKIIGNGSQLYNLKELVSKYKLNDYIFFYGAKGGEELDDIIKHCDIGIGSIANHRKGLTKDSSLKNREYCARGIPFVIASIDEAFKNFKYVLKIPSDETPIDIEDVIEFYNSMRKENYTNEMREYAQNNLTWESVMKPLFKRCDEYFKRNI